MVLRTWGLAAVLMTGCFAITGCGQRASKTSASITRNEANLDDVGSTDLPPGVLDRHELIRFIRAYRGFKPEDQFAPAFDDRAIRGRRFHFTAGDLDPDSLDLHPGGPAVSYDQKRQQAMISFSVDYQDDFNFLPLLDTTVDGPTHPESNAFGVSVDVKPTLITKFGVGSTSCRGMALFKSDGFSCHSLVTTLSISGPQARKLNEQIVAEIDGTIGVNKDGQSLVCTSSHETPTITDPNDITTDTCIIEAKITKVVLRSPSAGIIAQWPAGSRIN